MKEVCITEQQYAPAPAEQENSRTFFEINHFYQPPRDILLPENKRVLVVPEVNEKIFQECYLDLLVEGITFQEGLGLSLYPSLRYWIEDKHPKDWKKIKASIDMTPQKEWKILADPYVHLILPFMDDKDKDMMVKIGKRAFEKDFGFSPKGMWLPEAAVDIETLEILVNNGYQYTVLGSNQVDRFGQSANPVKIKLNSGDIYVLCFNKGLSNVVGFKPEETHTVEQFLDKHQEENIEIAIDGETLGHHLKGKQFFLKHLSDRQTLNRYRLAPMDIDKQKNGFEGILRDDCSSWSCEHGLNRWLGECNCGDPSDKVKEERKYYFSTLQALQERISSELDNVYPNWREEFIRLVVSQRKEIMTGKDFISPLRKRFSDQHVSNYVLAEIYEMLAWTSCWGFFGEEERPEREIPKQLIPTIQKLIK